MMTRNWAAILIIGVVTLAGTVQAEACGTVKKFASVYLAAEQDFTHKAVRARCQFRMLGALLCVDKYYLKEKHAKRLLSAALAHAQNSGDPRLKCAAREVAQYFSVGPAKKTDMGGPALKKLIRSISPRGASLCAPGKLGSAAEIIRKLPRPAQRLRQCL